MSSSPVEGAGVRRVAVSEALSGVTESGPMAGLRALVGDRQVIRAGISYWGPGERSWPDRVHRHREPEMFFCLHGSGQFETPDGALEAHPGDLFFFGPEVEHHQVGGPAGLCMAWWLLECDAPGQQ